MDRFNSPSKDNKETGTNNENKIELEEIILLDNKDKSKKRKKLENEPGLSRNMQSNPMIMTNDHKLEINDIARSISPSFSNYKSPKSINESRRNNEKLIKPIPVSSTFGELANRNIMNQDENKNGKGSVEIPISKKSGFRNPSIKTSIIEDFGDFGKLSPIKRRLNNFGDFSSNLGSGSIHDIKKSIGLEESPNGRSTIRRQSIMTEMVEDAESVSVISTSTETESDEDFNPDQSKITKQGETANQRKLDSYFKMKNRIRYLLTANVSMVILIIDSLVSELYFISNTSSGIKNIHLLISSITSLALFFLIIMRTAMKHEMIFKTVIIATFTIRMTLDLYSLHSNKKDSHDRLT